jgi:hypothetical protein
MVKSSASYCDFWLDTWKTLRLRMTLSSSTNAVGFSSARRTKRFASPQCASPIQIVRPSRSRAEMQPQLHPALLEIVRDDFQRTFLDFRADVM